MNDGQNYVSENGGVIYKTSSFPSIYSHLTTTTQGLHVI